MAKIKFETVEQVEEFMDERRDAVIEFSEVLSSAASNFMIRDIPGAINPSQLVEEYAKVNFENPDIHVVLTDSIKSPGKEVFKIAYFATLRKNKANLPHLGIEQEFCFKRDSKGLLRFDTEESVMKLNKKSPIRQLEIERIK